MLIIGYAAILGYVFFLIFLVGPIVQHRTDTEISRKVIHTSLFLVWVLIDLFFKNTVHQIIVPVIFLILNTLSYKFKLYKSVEREDGNHMGTIYFAIAITCVMTAAYFAPVLYYLGGIASFCLTFGDGFAGIIGYSTSSKKLINGKTVNGFLACIAFSAAAVFAFCALYPVELSLAAVLVIALSTAIFELVGRGLDNFSVTFGSFLLSWLLISFGNADMLIGMGTALAVFLVVFFSGSINYPGSLLSMLTVFSFYYFGGLFGLLYLLGTFFTIFFVSLVKKKIRPDMKKEHSRGFIQILINGGLGLLFVVLYGLRGDVRYMAVSVAAIGGCFIDSLSSDVGVMSRSEPFDIWKRTSVPAGLSGGMSALGTTAAFLGSAVIGLMSAVSLKLTPADGFFLAFMCFMQTLLDSFLGSTMQVKYRCAVCGEITEKKEHCGKETEYLSGVRAIDNNAVNLISSIFITAVTFIFYFR